MKLFNGAVAFGKIGSHKQLAYLRAGKLCFYLRVGRYGTSPLFSFKWI